jgi:Sulfotransferase family
MRPTIALVRIWRKLVRRLNWYGLFVRFNDSAEPVAVLAGYTRSGTTFLGRLLANIVGARPIHEPLNPNQVPEVKFFNEREARSTVEGDSKYKEAIAKILSPNFKGTKYTNTGSSIFYAGRVIKLVRANHYLDYISNMIPGTPFVVIMRNPCSCIASRVKEGWPVPDHSHSIKDIAPFLSKRQMLAYQEAGSTVSRLAVSWCLDNYMLLRNADNPRFFFVFYESILANPQVEMERILLHVDTKDYKSRIRRELKLESDYYNVNQYLQKWKNTLSDSDLKEIENVLEVFGLDGYYDLKTGLPLNRFPFYDCSVVEAELGSKTV